MERDRDSTRKMWWKCVTVKKNMMKSLGMLSRTNRLRINGKGKRRGNWVTLANLVPKFSQKLTVRTSCMCVCVLANKNNTSSFSSRTRYGILGFNIPLDTV